MKMFKTLILAVAAFAAVTRTTQAQYTQGVKYNWVATSLIGGTNNIAATTTNTAVGIAVDCPLTSMVGLQPSFKLDAAGTTAVVFKFDRSLNKSFWETNAYSVSVTPAGTALVGAVGTVTNGPIGYLRLNRIENPNSAAITNLVFVFSLKNGL